MPKTKIKDESASGTTTTTLQVFNAIVADLKPDPENVRQHDRRNIQAIINSLRRFGQQKPIVIDRNSVVVAGNGTLQAAKELGWTTIMAVRTELEGDAAKAFAIADNRTAELAEWEEDKLNAVLKSLQDEGFELVDVGFEPITEETTAAPESSAEEIDTDAMEMECRCPKCGFEFDPKGSS